MNRFLSLTLHVPPTTVAVTVSFHLFSLMSAHCVLSGKLINHYRLCTYIDTTIMSLVQLNLLFILAHTSSLWHCLSFSSDVLSLFVPWKHYFRVVLNFWQYKCSTLLVFTTSSIEFQWDLILFTLNFKVKWH